MSRKIFGCGVIGCGVIAPTHLEGYEALPNAKTVHLCDLRRERTDALGEKYHVERRSTDYHELLADPEVEVVSVCTDHASHAQIVIDALNAGKHVICEKSIGRVPEDLKRMIEAAEAHPELCAAGIFQHRFERNNNRLKQLIEEGVFGKILTVNLCFSCLRTNQYYEKDAWRGTQWGEGGGVLINQAIHYCDLVRYLVGDVKRVSALTGNFVHQGVMDVEDTAVCAMEMKNGALAVISATSGGAAEWYNKLTITGTKTMLEYGNEKAIRVESREPGLAEEIMLDLGSCASPGDPLTGKTYYGGGHTAQLAEFLQAIEEKRHPRVPVRTAAESSALIFAVYASAKSGNWVEPETLLR